MAFLSIQQKELARPCIPFLSLGFRPFFLGASLFSVLTIGLWMGVYVFQLSIRLDPLSSAQWHAHEMIYGYGLAVIAGFLLTAARNWTQLETLRGWRLGCLFGLWMTARGLFLFGTNYIASAAVFDLLFIGSLVLAVLLPIVRTRQWRQLAIVAKLVFLALGNATFYLGLAGWIEDGVYWGLYGGLYLIISLIMTVGARVMPGFIENGVDNEITLTNPRWVGIASLIFFLIFFIVELFIRRPFITAIAAMGLFVVTTIRLIGWHAPGIWKKPLLWCLYVSFIFIDAGFLLFALTPVLGFSKFIAIHALAFGGIGLITMGMMSRVSLGHSGRSIHNPPRTITYSFLGLIVGTLARVLLPLIWPAAYVAWIALAQGLWIISFLLFGISYAPILLGSV